MFPNCGPEQPEQTKRNPKNQRIPDNHNLGKPWFFASTNVAYVGTRVFERFEATPLLTRALALRALREILASVFSVS